MKYFGKSQLKLRFFCFTWYFEKNLYTNSPVKTKFFNMEKIKERFLVIVKPGFFESRFEIREMLLQEGDFEIISEKATRFTKEVAKLFYSHLENKPFFQEVIDYMTSDIVYTIVFNGDIEMARSLVGPTDPCECQPWQIRAKNFGPVDKMRNVIHCSDSPASAEREIALVEPLPLVAAWFLIKFLETTVSFFLIENLFIVIFSDAF